tara:strand:+ start:3420 stop:3722 length:303 start_codon:yes stop_codon:yes gene_type:complete
MTNKKIKKILKELGNIDKESGIRFVFSYISVGKSLNDLDADVVHNMSDDLASNALINIIDEKIFENPLPSKGMDEIMEEHETMAKLHMFNLFNKNKKFEA